MALWNAAARSRSSALRFSCSAKRHSSNAAILDPRRKLINHGSHSGTRLLPYSRQSSPFFMGFSSASVAVLRQRLGVMTAVAALPGDGDSTCMRHLGNTTTCYSTAAMASAPSSSAAEYIPGRADPAGTANYARKIGAAAAPGHFRSFRLGGNAGDLVVSSIGMGTFGGSDTDAVDREYIESLTRGLTLGVNLIDCASNYRNMRSELAVGKCLSMAFKQGILNRNEVIICSKGGFLSFDYREDIDPYTYIDNKYIHTNLFTREEFVGGCHCLSPNFLKNQVDITRRNMGLDARFQHMELQHGVHFVLTRAAPFNGKLQEAANQPTQTVRDIRNKCPEIGEQRTDGQCALQFVRTTPGVMSALVGMRSGIHVEENAALIRVPASART
ncbi:hypothetical protein GOP47_0023727 [Adiantum capillus-veneris]|uniref:NADP-dependent oxidoreductase domain-containing protein n=1 Tax=Adiantum capillus-veneris TaxID=13818 RepID=A0A9D4Z5E7_ADICA|nr:hypothetical protein GOP47_0023727 [Adiantum capillus-veneris]